MSSESNIQKHRPGPVKRRRSIALLVLPVLLAPIPFLTELAFTSSPNKVCLACHEMRSPVARWEDSGASVNHTNCADCHFDTGVRRLWQTNKAALSFVVEHFRRDANDPIMPPPEPLVFEVWREPAYYSLAPNHRCYLCKSVPGHKPIEQQMSHRALIAFAMEQPCKDCHNHDMRNGQTFFEKILP